MRLLIKSSTGGTILKEEVPRVYAWPRKLPSNKYLDMLYDSMTERGIEVRQLRWRPHSIFRAACDHKKNKWFHFHWVGYAGKSHFGALGYWTAILLGMLILKLGRLKIAWTIHNLVPHDSRFRRIDRCAYTIILSMFVDVVITHANYTLDSLIEQYKWDGPAVVVPHGNYIDTYPKKDLRENLRRQYKARDDSIVFLFVGALSKYKGLDHLIKSFRQVDNPNIRLWIIGRGNESITRELKELTTGDSRIVIDARFVPDDELGAILGAVDVVILPYKEITTSGSLVLAFSFSKPVIVPEIGSIPEYTDSKSAILYDPETPNGLADAIKNSLDRDLLAMGKYAFNLACGWKWTDISRDIESVLVSDEE